MHRHRWGHQHPGATFAHLADARDVVEEGDRADQVWHVQRRGVPSHQVGVRGGG